MTRPLTGPGQRLADHDNLIRVGQPAATQPRVISRGGKLIAINPLTGVQIDAAPPVASPGGPSGAGGTSGTAGFSRVTVSGGVVTIISGPGLSTKAAAYTVTTGDDVVYCDATSAAFALTLPAAILAPAGMIFVQKIDSTTANAVTITATGTDTIDGLATYAISTQFASVLLYSDGVSKWNILARAFGKEAANVVLCGPSSGGNALATFRSLVVADIPNLPAAIITSGQLTLARGGTNADLSGTGGSGQYVKQAGVGSAFTVGVIAAADLPVFVASGASHAVGAVPDPGAAAGTTRFLCENATFAVPPSSGTSSGFSVWSSASVSYVANQSYVIGSDNNIYRCINSHTSSGSNNPASNDTGSNWELWYLRASITLNCGSGQRFVGSITDPAGIQQTINFIANTSGAASPATATITIQVANNGTFTIATGASTTSFTSNAQIAVGTTLLYSSGTGGNSGKSCRITVVTGSGPYTYTSDAGGGSTGLGSTPANGDVFTIDYGYGTNQILINLPIIGPNLIISGSTSTATVPLIFPTISDGGAGGSFAASAIYVAYTYTWSAGGATQETVPGFIQTFTPTASHKITLGSFTVPTGVTGVNVYISTTLNGALSTFKKQASGFTISGGVAQALTLSSNNAGANATTVNPVAAAYPSALSWASTMTLPLIKIIGTPGVTISNIYSYGNSNSNATGNSIEAVECLYFRLTNIVLSSATNGILIVGCHILINTVQIDNPNSTCFNLQEYTLVAFSGNSAAYGGTGGFVCNAMTYFGVSQNGFVDPSGTFQLAAYRNTTAFKSQWGSVMRIQTVTTNGQQVWNNTTTYTPTSGTTGNSQGYLEIS